MRAAAALAVLALAGCGGSGRAQAPTPEPTSPAARATPEPPTDEQHKGSTNAAAIAATGELIRDLDAGLVFANLVETDQVFGHRNDVHGFHGALREIDAAVGEWLQHLDPERDLLVLTADHGCDPTRPGTDHTREHAQLLARFASGGGRHDGPFADVGASVLRWLAGRDAALPGNAFVP